MVDAEMLARISLFAGMDPAERSLLARQVHERHYNRGSVIFQEGDPGEAAYFVCTGRVKIYRLSAEGTEQLKGLFGPGQPFGLVTALDSSPYPASAEAVEDSLVWSIKSEHLQCVLTSRPEVSVGVMKEVGSRLRQAHGRVHSLVAHSVPQRVAEYLLDQARQQGQSGQTGPVQIRVTMTHQELGSYLGASRESVTRALSDIRREGAIKASATDALLVDLQRLRSWLNL